ncbi:hypothetical protein [Halobacteriovorax sp. HLS]|uniref:hypothetical protein n=1 Tax=Halobacteriovorax sp. HLS TaxID=2234000 RepID=UPI000FDB0939|nr:hypothetical protein [Halobacteriovorax sp. HLS]
MHAKFSASVYEIPCEKIVLEVSSCEAYTFNNGLSNDSYLNFEGAVLDARIISREASKCHDSQKMDLSKYKELKLLPKKFVNNYSCSEEKRRITTYRKNYFCDTPGAKTIKACFISSISRKKSFQFLEYYQD